MTEAEAPYEMANAWLPGRAPRWASPFIAPRRSDIRTPRLMPHITHPFSTLSAVSRPLPTRTLSVASYCRKSTASICGATGHAPFAVFARTSSTRHRIHWQP